jgi:hypothetical protein
LLRCTSEWQPHRGDGVSQRNTGVGEGARIQDQKVRAFTSRLMHPPDQFVLRVALERGQLVATFPGDRRGARLDVTEGFGAIDVGLPGAQEIQIGAIDQEYSRHRVSDLRPQQQSAANLTQIEGVGGPLPLFCVRSRLYRRRRDQPSRAVAHAQSPARAGPRRSWIGQWSSSRCRHPPRLIPPGSARPHRHAVRRP